LSDHDLKIGLTNMTWSRAVGLLSTDLVVVIAAPITAIANATERAKNANRTSILRAISPLNRRLGSELWSHSRG
jgi:hypothetical protein